jgi:hypothetical protein
LVVTQGCCWVPARGGIPEPHFEHDESYPVRQVVVDPSSGELLKELTVPEPDMRFIDWDASGHHPLLVGEETCGAHHCSSTLFRLGDDGDPIELAVAVIYADW